MAGAVAEVSKSPYEFETFEELVSKFSVFDSSELQSGLEQLDHIERAVQLSRLAMVTAYAENENEGVVASFMSLQLATSVHATNEMLRMGKAMKSLPLISHAYEEGNVSMKQLVQLTRFVESNDDKEWAEKAENYSINQLKALADEKRAKQEAEELGVDPYALSRSLDLRVRKNCLVGRFRIPMAYGGAEVKKVIERLADAAENPKESTNACYRHRQADALVDLAKSAISESANPDRANISIHVELDDDGNFKPYGYIERTVVAFPELAEFFCEGRIRYIEEREGRIVGVGRAHRITPTVMANEVRYRDKGCRFPGCETKRNTHVHHIVEWQDGGTTDFHNLIELCARHHHLIHRSGWRIEGDPNFIVDFVNEFGVPMSGGLPKATVRTKAYQHKILNLFDHAT